jgi:hypothetical protein
MKQALLIIIHIFQRARPRVPKKNTHNLSEIRFKAPLSADRFVEGAMNIKRVMEITGMKRMMDTTNRGELNKLFYPIKEKARCNHIKSIFPIQRRLNEYGKQYSQNYQCTKMTPDKLGCLLCFSPNKLTIHHNLISNAYIYACSKDSINFIKKYSKNSDYTQSSFMEQESVVPSCKSVTILRIKQS